MTTELTLRSIELDALETEQVSLTKRLSLARVRYCRAWEASKGLVREETVLVDKKGRRFQFHHAGFKYGRISVWATPLRKNGEPFASGPKELWEYNLGGPPRYTIEGRA